MAEELQTLDSIRRNIQMLTGGRCDAARATEFINIALKTLWHDHSWSYAKADTTLTTRALKNTGTVTLTAPTTLAGTGTSFNNTDIGSYIRLGTGIERYLVTNVIGQVLVISPPHPAGTASAQSYVLFRHIYSLPSDFRAFLSGSYWDDLRQVTQQALDARDPYRSTTDSSPRAYAFRGPDASNLQQVELWPVPSTAVVISYGYLTALPAYTPLDGALTVPLRGDLVAFTAAAEALYTLALEPANAQMAQVLFGLGDRRAAKSAELLQTALRADRNVFGLPEVVRDWKGEMIYGADYLASHDSTPVS